MLAEEGEFPLGLGPVRRSGGIAKVAQRPDHLGDATGIVTEDLAVLLEPAGRHGMVGRGLQMFASMPEVDHLGFGRQGLQEGPVVGGAIGDSDDPDLGACSPDVCDFACKLRLQRELAALRHAAEIEGLQALALGVVEGDRAAGSLAPGGLGATVLAGSQRHHDAVEGDRGGGRVLRYALGLTDAAQRLRAEALPAFVHAQGQALQGAHRRRHGAGLRKERRRFPGRAVTHHQQTELGRRPRQVIVDEAQALVDRHRRCPARAAAVTRSPVGHRTERGHDRLRRHRDPEPALPVPLDPGSAIVPVLDDGAHDIASELVRGLTHPQLDLLGRLGARLGTKLLATQCEHPGGRLDDPRRQAGKIDGRRRRRRGYCHGNAPDVGFQDTAS